jgi:phage tail-like protein
MTWKPLRARITKHSSGPFNALGADVAMEEIVLNYERFEIELGMAVERDLPYGSFNFRVALGGRGRALEGFSEERLPTLVLHADAVDAVAAGAAGAAGDDYDTSAHLLLRRGFSGALDLYGWWDHQRRSKRSRGRTVTVELLDESNVAPVVAWRFLGRRPVALEYSPLNALESAVVVETIVLSFDHVEMS